jgi:hypothetical protein
MKISNILGLVAVSAILVACGGGGSSSSAPNRAPALTDPGALTVLEGATSIATISASDPDTDSLTFTLPSGDDQALFSIASSGVLSFLVAPDFETPGDAGSDNVYDISVQVSDGALTDIQSIVVTVTDAFEGRVVDAPISGATCFIDLNGNIEQDAGEPAGISDAAGFFYADTFTSPDGIAVKIICKGGTDTKTGQALPDLALISDAPTDLTKPANVTPLTTVLSSVSTPEAKLQLLQAMGIDKTPEELLTTDNWAAAEAGDEAAKSAQRVNQQLGLLLQTAATILDDGDQTTDASVLLAQSVAAGISEAAVSAGGIDLTSTDMLKEVLTKAIADVAPDAVIAADVIAAIASSLAAVNTVVSDPNLDPLSDAALDIVKAAQEGLQASVTAVVSGDVAVSEFETATDPAKLFENIVVAADALDTDEDGIPNVLDTDDDGDGVKDAADAFPLDKNETLDSDGDGIGDNSDDFTPGVYDEGIFDAIDWS